MMMASFLFKQKAREALKGNWQNALVVTFFACIFTTVAQVLQRVAMADVGRVMDSITYAATSLPQGAMTTEQAQQMLVSATDNISSAMVIGLLVVNVLSFLFTPVLSVNCNRYFIRLNVGEEIGVYSGLLGRMSIWHRALWLHIVMGIKIFLWTLLFLLPGGIVLGWLYSVTGWGQVLILSSLFVIPGIVAALRYSMAPYYLADDPSLTARQALAKSKAVMKDKKFAYFALQVSFIGWNLLINAVQLLLGGMLGTVLMLVAAQFMSLALSVYMNASNASFYRALSHPDGMGELYTTMRRRMKEAGMSDSDISATGFGAAHEEDQNNTDGDENL